MEFKRVTLDNIDEEHICCAISEKKGEHCVSSKKTWLKERMQEGLVFDKLDVRGKVFIEYLPAEAAWAPVHADNYMFIDCLWVSGQFHGQGYASALLKRCIEDSKQKGKDGIVVISSKGKKPFLSDAKFFLHQGFVKADDAAPYYELYYLPFHDQAMVPCFCEPAKNGSIQESGFVIYYTAQCPHTAKYVPLLVESQLQQGIKIKAIEITSCEEAKNAPAAVCTYAIFKDGNLLTNEILNDKSFQKWKDK